MGLPVLGRRLHSYRSIIDTSASGRYLFPKGLIAMYRRVLLALTCTPPVPCFAQTMGTITGEVKDSSGAVIPGATVSR